MQQICGWLLRIEGREYEVWDDDTFRKLSPSSIMDGAEESAVREVIRLRREWSRNVARGHEINLRELPALNAEIREKTLDTMSGYFTVRQLKYIMGPVFGAAWETLRPVALAAGLDDEVERYDALLNESRQLHRLTTSAARTGE